MVTTQGGHDGTETTSVPEGAGARGAALAHAAPLARDVALVVLEGAVLAGQKVPAPGPEGAHL